MILDEVLASLLVSAAANTPHRLALDRSNDVIGNGAQAGRKLRDLVQSCNVTNDTAWLRTRAAGKHDAAAQHFRENAPNGPHVRLLTVSFTKGASER